MQLLDDVYKRRLEKELEAIRVKYGITKLEPQCPNCESLQSQITHFKKTCNERRTIAIELAAEVAYEEWHHGGPKHVRKSILNLISLDQKSFDKLVAHHNLKETHGQRQ